jgi:catechol-2,3-dioxygenase
MWNDIDGMVSAYERGRLTRRELVAGLGVFLASMAGAPRVAAGKETDAAGSTFTATELNHVALDVTDVGRSRDWYIKHLGLTVRSDGERSCFLNCGDHFVALFRADEPGLNHYCYTIKGYDPARAVKALEGAGLSPRRTDDRVYFEDPDGITVQVSARNRREGR